MLGISTEVSCIDIPPYSTAWIHIFPNGLNKHRYFLKLQINFEKLVLIVLFWRWSSKNFGYHGVQRDQADFLDPKVITKSPPCTNTHIHAPELPIPTCFQFFFICSNVLPFLVVLYLPLQDIFFSFCDQWIGLIYSMLPKREGWSLCHWACFLTLRFCFRAQNAEVVAKTHGSTFRTWGTFPWMVCCVRLQPRRVMLPSTATVFKTTHPYVLLARDQYLSTRCRLCFSQVLALLDV